LSDNTPLSNVNVDLITGDHDDNSFTIWNSYMDIPTLYKKYTEKVKPFYCRSSFDTLINGIVVVPRVRDGLCEHCLKAQKILSKQENNIMLTDLEKADICTYTFHRV
jgi:hypothetical protein